MKDDSDGKKCHICTAEIFKFDVCINSTFFDGFLGFERYSFQRRLSTVTTFLIEGTSLNSLLNDFLPAVISRDFLQIFRSLF